jgi:activating signal cointegrator complex subunit 1
MSLLTPERIESALTLLKSLDLKAMLSNATGSTKEKEKDESPSLRITLKGLQSMHAPVSTSTLYVPPVESPSLLSFCQQLKDAFTAAELLTPDKRPLLLHATIVNTIYVPGFKKYGGHGKKKAKLTIDAEDLLEEWEDFTWMENVRVEKVAVCRMGAKKGEHGEERYEEEGSVEMP